MFRQIFIFLFELRFGNLKHQWALIGRELSLVESRLQQVVNSASTDVKNVGAYLLDGAGKRIRPALFLMAAYRADQDLEHLVDAATAFELLHTASLLHDDVIDQALTRRGKDAAHIKWSNKISVLTGDYLLSQAFKMLVAYHSWPLMNVVVDVVENMAEGEVEQAFANISSEHLEDKYFSWIGKKSAIFFAGCCQAGCLMADGDEIQQKIWSDYGFSLGVAFQLLDDYLDYRGEQKKTGKPLYGDLTNKVITLPLIRAIVTASGNGLLKCYLKNDPDHEGCSIEEIAKIVLKSDGLEYTLSKAEEYAKRSVMLIGKLELPGTAQKEMAAELPLSLIEQSIQ